MKIPATIEGYGKVRLFKGADHYQESQEKTVQIERPLRHYVAHNSKARATLKEAIEASNPHDGMTISFHHHLRAGDGVLMMVIEELSRMGFKDLCIASSSLTSAHEKLVPYVENGTVTKIYTSGVRDALGKAISAGKLATPVVIHSHGERARLVTTGELKIDIAFIAASAADEEGNCTGAFGPSAFGTIGYAMVDAQYAKRSVVITDNLVPFPCTPISIPQAHVDYVVKVDAIGDAKKIASGATRITKSPLDLRLAKMVADVINASGYMVPNFNFQLGSGGAALAAAKFLRPYLKQKNIVGGFLLGGVVAEAVKLKSEGFFKSIFDVQSFDNAVAESVLTDPQHIEISADQYANPLNAGCLTNLVDICVLSALEVDTSFNVNVITGSQGVIMAASGGHSDTAYGSRLAVVVCPTFRGRMPTVMDRVTTIVTPGESIDVIVTERGICVNPKRPDVAKALKAAGIHVIDIHDLKKAVDKLIGKPQPVEFTDKIVGVVHYRDGSVIDVIRQCKS